jgi:hypothetical protein
MFGLAQAQEAQGKKDQAAATHARFAKAFADADVKLTSARVIK